MHGLTYGGERSTVLLENSFRVIIDIWHLDNRVVTF